MESAHKSSSEEKIKMNPHTSKSCESLYSNNTKCSANVIYRNKANTGYNDKPNCYRGPPAVIRATNEVRQRVLSARRLRMKTFQNQLADAQQTIAELAHENRILRTLHKRQDSALSKYESNNAELPQLLHSHAEELRMWQTKYRNLQATNKDLEQKLKQKEGIILTLSDQNKHFVQLNKDKNLEDRQRLTAKLQMLEIRLQEKDNDMKMMARKMQLETKQTKQQLLAEQKKYKELLMKFEKIRLELSGYRKLEEFQLQEKCSPNLRRNKNNNADGSKAEKEVDKYVFANIEEETGDEIETHTSHRSNHSYNDSVQRTTRSIKNLNKTLSTLPATTFMMQASPLHKMATNKSVTISSHIDQGDGDASNSHIVSKINNSLNVSIMQRQLSNLSSKTQKIGEEKYEKDFDVVDGDDGDDYDNEDDDYENGNELDDHVQELKEMKEFQNNLTETLNVETEEYETGDNFSGVNSPNDKIDSDLDYNNDYLPESAKSENQKILVKKEICNIRKQITDDFKERETFLDTFCRQASNGVLRDESAKKRNSTVRERNVPNNRKHKLLAALKAIDDNKSQD